MADIKIYYVLFAVIYICGCTTTQINDKLPHITNETSLSKGVVLQYDFSDVEKYDDDEVEECIKPSFEAANQKVHIIPAKVFRDSLFPYFMPSVKPYTEEEYKKLLARNIIKRKLAELGVHYLVLIKKATTTDNHNYIFCGAGPGGGGCLKIDWWNRYTRLNVIVWDILSISIKGSIQTDSSGTGIMPAFLLPIPLYMPATEAAACKQIGKELGMALDGVK